MERRATPGLEPRDHVFQSWGRLWVRAICRAFLWFRTQPSRPPSAGLWAPFPGETADGGSRRPFRRRGVWSDQCRRSVVVLSPEGSSHERSIARDRREVLPTAVGASVLKRTGQRMSTDAEAYEIVRALTERLRTSTQHRE